MDILSLAIAKKSGGGGSTNAVKYTPQELTEEQQMQARKNLGLYYKESGATVIEWDGDTENKTSFLFDDGESTLTYCKMSDRVLSKNDFVGGTVALKAYGQVRTLDISDSDVLELEGLTFLSDGICLSANAGSYNSGMFVVPEDGTYFLSSGDEYTTQLNLPAQETIHKIEEKYLPDIIATKLYVDQQIGDAIGGEY